MSSFNDIPAPAKTFGLAGLIPFFVGAVACWINFESAVLNVELTGAHILCAYSAVILSFLGGIRWGVAMQHSSMIRDWLVVGWAMVPSLLAWTALLVNPRVGLLLLVVGFILHLVVDYRSSKQQLTEPWFLTLRIILTAGATLSILIGWVGFVQTAGAQAL